jgi:hypothetical protein
MSLIDSPQPRLLVIDLSPPRRRAVRNEMSCPSRRILTVVNCFVLRARRIRCDRMRTPTSFDGPEEVVCYTASVPRRLPIPTTKRGNGKEQRETGHPVNYSDINFVHADNLGGSRSILRSEESYRDNQLERHVLLSQLRAYSKGTQDVKVRLILIIL